MNFWTFLFIILGLAILGLSIYLGLILGKLKKQKRKEEETREFIAGKVKDVKESIVMISKATIQDQCGIAECILRIYHLLKQINLLDVYPIFKEGYEQIKDLDILEARNALSAREAFKQDKVRLKVEDEYKDSVIESCKKLVLDISL